MGRLIVYDNVVQENLNSFLKSGIQTGLIVGQYTAQKDIVVRLCPTPVKDEDSGEAGDKTKTNKKTTSAVNIDEHWICQHAKQLVRALPGGLDILGLYVIAPSDYTVKNQVHLRQVLFSIFKIKSLNLKLSLKETILLTICPMTSKITCRTYDVSDYKSSANPAEWKIQTGNSKWQRLRCRVTVDIKFPHKKLENNISLLSQIEMSLKSFFENIQKAFVFINGLQRELDEPLTVTEGKRSKKKHSSEKNENLSSEWHDVELFVPLGNETASSPEIFTATSMMTFKGIMRCQAYVHAKATVQEAINAIKQDIIRSIISRSEIHCEDLLLIEEEQSDPSVVHELPRRVFAPLPQADICVCDYQFHSDSACDSLDAFKELLNLELSEEDIDTSCEISPTTRALILPDSAEDKLSEFGDGPTQVTSNMLDNEKQKFHMLTSSPAIGVVTTIIIGVVAYALKSQWS